MSENNQNMRSNIISISYITIFKIHTTNCEKYLHGYTFTYRDAIIISINLYLQSNLKAYINTSVYMSTQFNKFTYLHIQTHLLRNLPAQTCIFIHINVY